VTDAYRGSEIKQALTDFFHAAAGLADKEALFYSLNGGVSYQIPLDAELVAYMGHDGLMDFPLVIDFAGRSSPSHSTIILACASRSYFRDLLRASSATALLWTTGLMAPPDGCSRSPKYRFARVPRRHTLDTKSAAMTLQCGSFPQIGEAHPGPRGLALLDDSSSP
jgi:hypothetical protein